MKNAWDIRSDFLEANKDWAAFGKQVSDNTGDHYQKMWEQNISANKQKVKEHGWAAEHLQDSHAGKTAVMLGGSPAITKQFEKLRELQYDPDFVFVGLSSNIRFLLANGIQPRYVMVADADPIIEDQWKDMEMEKTKGITLIANLCSHPAMTDAWRGHIRFLALYTAIQRLDKKINKLFKPVNGCGQLFPALCSQYNVGTALAHLMLGCKIVIFVGNELSFPTDDSEKSTYYPDRKDIKDKWARKPHPNIYGEKVYTGHMLMSLKLTLEDFLGKLSGAGFFFNCTEAGIFGVSVRHGNLPWIQQMTLKTGIAQARHIMRYGEPIYQDRMVVQPSLKETLAISGGI